MKLLNEYKTIEEVLEDAIKESLVARLKPIKEERVERIRKQALDYLTEAFGKKNVQRHMLNRVVRADLCMREFRIAIQSLVDEKLITEEKQVTSNSKRPAVYYRLFEN